MAKLPKYTLGYDAKKEDWALKQDGADRAKKRFVRKSDATIGGVLEGILGNAGGAVKIKKQNGRIQEERTYPRSADPKRSPG